MVILRTVTNVTYLSFRPKREIFILSLRFLTEFTPERVIRFLTSFGMTGSEGFGMIKVSFMTVCSITTNIKSFNTEKGLVY